MALDHVEPLLLPAGQTDGAMVPGQEGNTSGAERLVLLPALFVAGTI